MNADWLIAGFDLLGDGPESIRQLRKLVVGLAVSGRLDIHGPECMDPQVMTRAIDERRRALGPTGAVRQQAASAVVSVEELPAGFVDPARFVRLGSVARIEKGPTGIMKAKPGPYPLVATAEERASCDHFDFDGTAAIIPLVSSAGHGKASLQRLHYQEGKFALGSILAAIFPYVPDLISARFLYEYLTAFKDELLVQRMIGTANVSLSIGKIAEVPIPLVEPAVQWKVDELMALCDRLEAARTERETTRARLTTKSLARLNAPDPDPAVFAGHARFALDNIASLTARPDQLTEVRRTILSLAVRGKLVRQDPNDEPAAELIERIAAEKARLANGSAPRGQRSDRRERAEGFGFSLPQGWALSTLGSVALKITDGAHHTPTYVGSGIPFVSVKDFSAGRLDLSSTRLIPEAEHRVLYKRCDPKRGDILIGRIGTLGRAVLVDTDVEFSLFVSVGLIRFCHVNMVPEFFRTLLNSPLVEAEFDRIKIGGATHTNKLNLGDLQTVALPIPPLAEQRRIVTKVNELMALCNQLEASLARGEESRGRLLEAVLHEALAPTMEKAA